MPNKDTAASIDAELRALKNGPATSRWLSAGIATAMTRDPIDAANDAEILADLLKRRADAILKSY